MHKMDYVPYFAWSVIGIAIVGIFYGVFGASCTHQETFSEKMKACDVSFKNCIKESSEKTEYKCYDDKTICIRLAGTKNP